MATFPNIQSNFSFIAFDVALGPNVTNTFIACPLNEFLIAWFTKYAGYTLQFIRYWVSSRHCSKLLSFIGVGSILEKLFTNGLTRWVTSVLDVCSFLSSDFVFVLVVVVVSFEPSGWLFLVLS